MALLYFRVLYLPLALLVVGACFLSTAASAQKPAQEPKPEEIEEARQRYERGRRLFDAGQHDAALAELERAYQLAPTPALLYNIGLVHVERGDAASAVRTFERFVAEVTDPADKRRTEVEKRLEDLKVRVARLRIQVSQPGAELSVDDVVVGLSPLSEPWLVNVGRHRIVATKQGRSTARVVTVAGGDVAEVTLDLEPPPTEAPPPEPVIRSAPRPAPGHVDKPTAERTPRPLWIGWAVAGTLTAAAVSTGVAAWLTAQDFDELQATRGVPLADLEASHDRLRALTITTDVLGAAAVVATGVTLALTLVELSGSEGVKVEASLSSVALHCTF
jgi:tetratricopeptide (TPR) repeat protein